MNIYNKLPLDIQIYIDNYRFEGTNLCKKYRKKLNILLNVEIKRNFCFNCRRYFKIKKIKHINYNFIKNNLPNIYDNIYNSYCFLENDIDNNDFIINHWLLKDIKIIRSNNSNNSYQYNIIKLYSSDTNYGFYKIRDCVKFLNNSFSSHFFPIVYTQGYNIKHNILAKLV